MPFALHTKKNNWISIKTKITKKESKVYANAYMKASVESIWYVLNDFDNHHKFMPAVVKVTLLEKNKYYMKTRQKLKVGIFTVTFYFINEYNNAEYFMSWKQIKGALKVNKGYWKLIPQKDGNCVVYYHGIVAHPLIPDSLIKNLLEDKLPGLFTAVEKRAQQIDEEKKKKK